ncbi:MAG: NADH-quinone oxidoreductase subunit C [Gammaproteobacteria bacterium]|nr:NADH-quinone oxidoreductase subunit C [Gammaproteobacteria bacterium]NNJ71990.1 NADH-quinone oxidoreductase subunit C [Enterobacterales bacterium]
MTPTQLNDRLAEVFGDKLADAKVEFGEVTIEVAPSNLIEVCQKLRDDAEFTFTTMIDLSGVDYSAYGMTEWDTESATGEGFSRGVDTTLEFERVWTKLRFASVIHLLSIEHNHRLRVKTFVDENDLRIPTVTPIWNGADWYERESFDLFGILYEGHEDLRRILTDYSFVGHPFRKDFPLIGHVEMRYDATENRCVYEPVSIEARINVPRVIRDDLRYGAEEADNAEQTTK